MIFANKYTSTTTVRVSVCLFTNSDISKSTAIQTSLNFLHMLPVSVAWSSSDGNALCGVLPVSLMTSCVCLRGGRIA